MANSLAKFKIALITFSMVIFMVFVFVTRKYLLKDGLPGPKGDKETIFITNWTKLTKLGQLFLPGRVSFQHCTQLEPSMDCLYDPSASAFLKADAVIFRGLWVSGHNIPVNRPPNQKWIFMEGEPPTKSWPFGNNSHLGLWQGFNLTSTYTQDSDIPLSAFHQVCKPVAQDTHHVLQSPNYAINKTGFVVWYVSHCNTPNRRELYVKELQKYVAVDIIGHCGHKDTRCGLKTSSNFMSARNKKCALKTVENYKFYLAFENSICEDYYTEKLVKTLPLNVITVVMGGANYTEFLPKDSYLDVRDYASPQELAQFMMYLNRNDSAYSDYIIKKKTMTCFADKAFSYGSYPCRLCHHLHTKKNVVETADDIRLFWGEQRRCQRPKDFFIDIADDIITKTG